MTVRTSEHTSRRQFLAHSAAGIGGLTLSQLLRAEAAAGVRNSRKAVINIHLDGGPPQMDMIDMKPDAPREIRGEFTSIPTAISGFRMVELMPKVATLANKFAFIRSIVGCDGRHDAFQCVSGFETKILSSMDGRPALGSVLAKLKGKPTDDIPAFVDMFQGRPLARNSARPGFLGAAYTPFRPDMSKLFKRELEPHMVGELASLGHNHVLSLSLNDALTPKRLRGRVDLLGEFDRFRRDIDRSGSMEAMDHFTQQAVSILTSSKFAEAMDLSREDPEIVERYTLPEPKLPRYKYSDEAKATTKLLLARRLVEAGVRYVTVSFSDFDTHAENYPRLRYTLPIVDHALSTLVTDLEERGMLDDVTIIAWGEFGRTPQIDLKSGGRHHWTRVAPAILAGGGMKVGQVIGATDKHAGYAVSRPVDFQDVFATLYRNIGIDLSSTTILDPSGRPQYLVEHGKAIKELI